MRRTIIERTRGHLGGVISLSIAALMLTVLTGCGARTAEATTQGSDTGPVTVNVTLKDFSVTSSLTRFKTGVPYHIVITNKGKVAHELMLMKPMPADTTMDMEAMDKMALAIVEEEDLPPGASQTLDITFDKAYPAGTLEFSCHVPGHYAPGMKLPVTVE